MSRESTAPRTAVSLLRDPVFGPYFGAKVFSTAGIWAYNIVAAILVYDLTRSAFQVGLVSVAQFAPQLVFAPLAGVVADRWDRRRLLILGRLAIVLGSGGLALLVVIVGVTGLPGAWPVLVGAGVVGIGFAISAPAQNALLPSLVERKDLAPAIALNAVPPTLARAAGPALGALIAATAGPATAFGLAALTNLLFIAVLWRLRVAPHRRAAGSSRDDRMRAGVLHLWNDRVSALLILAVMAVSIGSDPVLTLTPALAASFGGGAQLVGTLASAFGIGTALTFVFLHRVRGRIGLASTGTSGLVLMSIGTALTSFAAGPLMAVVTLAIAGVGFTLAMTAFSTLLQQRLPEEVRGRVMALWSVSFLGSRPLASALHGSIADSISNQAAFLTSALAV
ncbi:MAG TPA: MFS transporter, partial [Acidimicrobiia bacterium]|nr:MFS transporter [Acidimicrobiia bacterium]